MDYEQKYKEALERAKYCLTTDMDDSGHWAVKHIFPELAESEDERIRKALIRFHKSTIDIDGIKGEDILAWLKKQESVGEIVARCKTSWYNEGKIQGQIEGLTNDEKYQQGWHDALEKQGERKPADKVEPKFKVGDWIVEKGVNGNTVQITKFEEDKGVGIRVWFSNGTGTYIDFLKGYHLWTIQDAKEGDVLYFDDDTIVIFKNLYNISSFHSYCHIEDGEFGFATEGMPDWWKAGGFCPATKEQRDLLFQKMKEAGYVWDEDKKELRKIKKQGESIKIKKGKNYLCTKTHKYAGVEWIEGVKYYSSEDYSLVNQGCTYYCPKYSKKNHTNFFKEVEYDGWLEKQGEQKLINKVEPKFNFRVGQWIVTTGKCIYLIAEIEGFNVTLVDNIGNEYVFDVSSLADAHLWTIQDAKDGDVLCYKDEIFIYKHDIKNCTEKETSFGGMVYYCCYDGKRFITDSMYSLTEKDKDDIHPATKEQREILFQQMKETGYEWDAEKK